MMTRRRKKTSESNKKQEVSNLFSDLRNTDDSKSLSLDDLSNLLQVENLLKEKNYAAARKLALSFYERAKTDDEKSRYIAMLLTISEKNDDNDECLRWCDRLIQIDKNDIRYKIKKSQYITDFRGKFNYLISKSKYQYPND